MSDQPEPNSEFILYQAEDGRTRIPCRLEGETVWLTQQLMSDLFGNPHLASPTERGGAGVSRNFRIAQFTTQRTMNP